jgi:hypothetical protein
VRAGGVPLRVVAVGAAEPVAGADLTLADADGHFRQRYGVLAGGAAYLLRPDQHICARWMSLDADRLQSALKTALGGAASTVSIQKEPDHVYHSTMLSVPDLEQVYDALATAIDTAGPEKSELFLVKLALLNANALGDAAAFEAQVAAALKDL